jgi:hypothetical protein
MILCKAFFQVMQWSLNRGLKMQHILAQLALTRIMEAIPPCKNVQALWQKACIQTCTDTYGDMMTYHSYQ